MESPQHPALSLAEEGFVKFYQPLVEAVERNIVAETSYNIAFPMMALALHCGKEKYLARALHQLEVNREHLAGEDALWLRWLSGTGEKTFRSWSRGVAWYFPGLVRTLSLISSVDRPASLVVECERMAGWVARRQLDSGLWPCFMDEPEIAPDSSGCAGIAAAVALAARDGLVAKSHRATAETAYRAITATYLDPDGWLRGASQSNKREAEGIDLQRSSQRVIGPWGMGLYAQLAAALGPG